MLTAVTEEDWTIVLRVFAASRSRRGDKGRNDRKFLEALHYFVVHNITWRALPEKFGHWNSVWKRFWRLSRSGTFEAFFDALAAMSETAHLVQCPSSEILRQEAAGTKRESGASWLMLRGLFVVKQPTVLDGLAFDPFSFQQDGLTAPEVDVGRGEIVDAS